MRDADFVELMKSTIVRSNKPTGLAPVVRAAGMALSAVAPAMAARIAERMFLTPRRPRRPATERTLLAGARSLPLSVGGRRVETWTWGAGPLVLLVHGWSGRGGQLGALVDPLVVRGLSVATFDAPGHGDSDPGLVTIPEMAAAVAEVAAAAGRPVAGLVAHSLGATAAMHAIREGLGVGAAVLLAPPAELLTPSDLFAQALGLSRPVTDRMRALVERRTGLPWSAFDVRTLGPVSGTPLLVVHDRADAEIPWQHGVRVAEAWPGAEMLTTEGLGHRRILRSPEVVGAAVAFVAARSHVAAPSRPPAVAPGAARAA